MDLTDRITAAVANSLVEGWLAEGFEARRGGPSLATWERLGDEALELTRLMRKTRL